MDINTGNIVSNSSNFLKKLKETGEAKANKTKLGELDRANLNQTKKIKDDFADIKFSDKRITSKLVENNDRLSKYEGQLSKLQFIQQKIDELTPMIESNNFGDASKIIENSVYNNEQVLKDYFTVAEKFPKELTNTKEVITKQQTSLQNEFKSIEIASQNILSLFPYSENISSEFVQNINLSQNSTSYNLSNKRVMDLIS